MRQTRAARRQAEEAKATTGDGFGCLCAYCGAPYEAVSWAKPWLCKRCVSHPSVQYQPSIQVEPLGLLWVTSG